MAKIKKLKKGECKDIEEVTIQFENCELITLSRKEISNIFLYNIRKHISICINAVIEDYEAEEVWLVVDKEVAKKKHEMWGDSASIEERFAYNDITHFYIKYNTGEEECISCVWEGDDQFTNPAQKAYWADEDLEEGEEPEYFCLSISPKNV